MHAAPSRTALALSILLGSMAIPVVAQDAAVPIPGLPADFPLEATPWRLVEYAWLDTERAVGPEVVSTVRFSDGALQAEGGCNRLDGTYRADDAALEIMASIVTARACAEQTMIVELAVAAGLERAASYRIDSGADIGQSRLTLSDAFGNELLRYRVDDPSRLTTPTWRLERYVVDGLEVVSGPEPPALASFDATGRPDVGGGVDGSAIFSSGCNGLVADFFQRGSVLSFGPVDVTDGPCAPDLAARQAAMLAIMEATALSISLPAYRLVLESLDTGDRLEFVTTAPLEGTTWLASRLAGRAVRQSESILRLEGGVARGFGPCGEFEARYVSDGTRIRFDGVPGVPDDCATPAVERRFRAALRQSRFVDMTRPALRLLDGTGALVARFEDPGGP